MRDYKKTISDLRNFNANYEANKLTNDAADAIEELLARLAAYEDTGMTPKEIEDCKEKWNKMSMRERLDTIAEHAELFPDRSKCVELDLEPGDLRNIVELFEDQFFEHLKFLLDEGELDNIEYLRSMLRIYDQLCAAQAKEEA
jgi:hypothetical protein